MSFCTVHQMPTGARGCPQCAREDALAHRTESGRFWWWALVVFAALAALAAAGIALAPRQARWSDPLLDPTPFRTAIVATESALYGRDRFTPDDQMALRQGLMELHIALRKQFPSRAWRSALADYERFCVMTPVEAESPYFDVVAARKEWERLRQQHFKPAPWFRVGSASLDRAQTAPAARGIPDDIAKYQAALDQLRLLAARVEAEAAGDPSDFDAPNRWNASRAAAERDLERLQQEMPARFPGMDPSWRRACDDLDRALRGIGSTLRSSSPSSARMRGLVDQAQKSLDAAVR
jgi:hypothetical protein